MSKKKKKQQQQAQAARSPLREAAPIKPAPASRMVATAPSAAALGDEGPEPATGDAPIPVLLVALLALLVYLADVHLINRGAEFDPKVYYPYYNFVAVQDSRPRSPIDEIRKRGRMVYKNCEPCHQANGQGLPGQFPALAGSEWVIGASPTRTIHIVLSGVAGPIDVVGNHFDSTAMPPWKGPLSDQQIADVISFIRTEWGNKAGLVTPEQVKKIRDAEKDRDTPWTEEALKKMSD